MDVQKTKVILVGNSTFPKWGGEKKDIPNVEQNLELLKNIFINPNYFGIPDDPQHLVEIRDEPSQEILIRVKHETKSFQEKESFERLIFYYCGHGIPGEDSKLFFASKDTVRSDYEITSVDSQRLFSYLEGFGARELIVILDCCYAAQSKENQGDADSLISKSLPEDREVLDETENGIYYLFAAGKDNVAKFNPKEPKKPTYFTEALLSSIGKGTETGNDFVTIGEIYNQVRKEIAELKKNANPDIPEPRPVLHGNVNGFIFCKNFQYKNQEDKEWLDLRKDPSRQAWLEFKNKYPETRFDKEMDELLSRMIKGEKALKILDEKKDIDLAIEIKTDYKNIPYIMKEAARFINDQAARPLEVNAVQNPGHTDISPVKEFSNASVLGPAGSVIEKEAEAKSMDTGATRPMYGNAARK